MKLVRRMRPFTISLSVAIVAAAYVWLLGSCEEHFSKPFERRPVCILLTFSLRKISIHDLLVQ